MEQELDVYSKKTNDCVLVYNWKCNAKQNSQNDKDSDAVFLVTLKIKSDKKDPVYHHLDVADQLEWDLSKKTSMLQLKRLNTLKISQVICKRPLSTKVLRS